MNWSGLKTLIKSLLSPQLKRRGDAPPTSSYVNSDIEVAFDSMQSAISAMSRFSEGYVPRDLSVPELERADSIPLTRGASYQEIMADPGTMPWLNGIMATWPEGLSKVFVQSSHLIAQILEGFGAGRQGKAKSIFGGGIMEILEDGLDDPDSIELLMILSRMRRESAELAKDDEDALSDPMGFEQAAWAELARRRLARHIPLARTLTTLLGQDALVWLTTEGQQGIRKLQPHEFSRTGWRNLWSIRNQLEIEQELMNVPPEFMHLAKIVVALSWTLTALASFIEPAVFIGERTPHFTSVRGEMRTVSSGVESHTLISFQTAAMPSLVRILADALRNPLFSAADLMWMGAGLVRVREVRSGLGDPFSIEDERFELFLSHRGRDAKLTLSTAVQGLNRTHGIFLDCLTLPRGVINRSFVFGSLAKSERVLIVRTRNFDESEWCRKEACFADMMARHGLARVERVALSDATVQVTSEGGATVRRRPRQELRYNIAHRVRMDMENWMRAPNLHSLKEASRSTESLAPLESALAAREHPEDPAWVLSMGKAVEEGLSATVAADPEAEPFDLWATALQLAMAVFASTSRARSKIEVRRGIDQLNAVLKSLIDSGLHREPVFRSSASGHLSLLAAAVAIDLTGFELDPRMVPAVRMAVDGTAGLRDGLLLLDVREPGPERDFRLRLIALLIQGNLGSVGIVQDAADEVHQGRVGALPLEVLPCVTLYPGMEAPFDHTPLQ